MRDKIKKILVLRGELEILEDDLRTLLTQYAKSLNPEVEYVKDMYILDDFSVRFDGIEWDSSLCDMCVKFEYFDNPQEYIQKELNIKLEKKKAFELKKINDKIAEEKALYEKLRKKYEI